MLAAALQFVDFPGYAALILRRTFPELRGADGLLARSHAWWTNTDARWNEQTHTWRFPSGALIEFGHVESEQDRFKYDGRAYQYIGFDELTSFTQTQYEHIGFTRGSPQISVPVPLRTRGSCTPTGQGVGWVRRRLITNRDPEVSFIPAKVTDNPGVDAVSYAASLDRVDATLRRRLLEGDWEAFEGQAFPAYDPTVHVVPRFDVPDGWERFEHMDYGVSNPTAWYSCAVDYDGNLIVCDGIYRPGLPSEIAPLVKERRDQGWGQDSTVWADPSIWNNTGTTNRWGRPASTADEFISDCGISLARGNNDRRAGYIRIAELLAIDPQRRFPGWNPNAGQTGAPRLYVMDVPGTAELRGQLGDAPLEEEGKHLAGEAIAAGWEGPHGHAVASLRYGLMSRPSPSAEKQQPLDDPRAEFLRQEIERRDEPTGRRNTSRYYHA